MQPDTPDPDRRKVLKYAGLAGASALGVSTVGADPVAAAYGRSCSPRALRRADRLDRVALVLDRVADRLDQRAAYLRAKAGDDGDDSDGPPTPPGTQ